MKSNKLKLDKDNSVELVTSILITYPTINTVDINLENKGLEISFLIDHSMTDNSWLDKKSKLEQNFRLFNKFQNRTNQNVKFIKDDYEDLSRLKFIRSLDQCSENELSFMIQVIEDIFGDKLLKNENLYPSSAFSSIDQLLERVRKENIQEQKGDEYLGFIEEDKVLVFNKNRKD
ncbi:hypothetical protein [Orenia marismortui]|uniref:Uncharacterized protein n=1 Tax=Orenia marismortui TaxID=46469 RepID=A0A4R8H627_9FIRM|nr:hypothetical protein [Orenia marismortui]TDX52906.1 hypothetical protein C7959_10431 [Orenia marismortui]